MHSESKNINKTPAAMPTTTIMITIITIITIILT